jgi:hypothetical protein
MRKPKVYRKPLSLSIIHPDSQGSPLTFAVNAWRSIHGLAHFASLELIAHKYIRLGNKLMSPKEFLHKEHSLLGLVKY